MVDETIYLVNGQQISVVNFENIVGSDGADNITGSDESRLSNGSNALWGGDGNDTIDGGSGDDNLYGDAGNDIIYGGIGDDILTGGNGSDQFVFKTGDGQDTITDFNLYADKLYIDDMLIDMNSLPSEVTLTQSGTDTVLTYEADGSGSITLIDTNLSALVMGDEFDLI